MHVKTRKFPRRSGEVKEERSHIVKRGLACAFPSPRWFFGSSRRTRQIHHKWRGPSYSESPQTGKSCCEARAKEGEIAYETPRCSHDRLGGSDDRGGSPGRCRPGCERLRLAHVCGGPDHRGVQP